MKGQVMATKLTAFVKIYDDKIETTNEQGDFWSRYWVVDAGIHPEHLYPCVMVELLLEIQHLQNLGFEVIVVDKRGQK